MPKASAPSSASSLAPAPTPAPGGLVGPSLVPAARPSSLAAPSSPGLRATPNGHATPETAGSDFVVLDEPKKTTVGMIFARDGIGKTWLVANHCPQPVVIIGLDGRGEREVKKALNKGRKVFYLDASMPFNVLEMEHAQAQAAAGECLRLITKNFEWAIEKSIREWGGGTLVFDTFTEARDIVQVTVRGRVDRPNPKAGDRGGNFVAADDALVNRTIKYLTDRARQSNLNLILLSRAKPIYEGRNDTGRVTWDNHKVASQAVDWIVEYRKVDGLTGGLVEMPAGGFIGAPGTAPGMPAGVVLGMPMTMPGLVTPGAPSSGTAPTYELVATNPKLAHGETGAVYRQAEWEAEGVGPFAYLCERVVPGSTADDWR